MPLDAPIGPVILGALLAGAAALLAFFVRRSFDEFSTKLDKIAEAFICLDKASALFEQRLGASDVLLRELCARLSRVETLTAHLERRSTE